MSKINIPEPCHENWAEFTPTEKGAFCGSCQIDVIDFSNKNPTEIKSILKENAGKHLCGRFKKTQLIELNDDFFAWKNQSARSLQSKFLYACLVVFGMTLFTGCNTNQHVLGDIYYERPVEETNEYENPDSSIQETPTSIHPENGHKKGKIKYVPEQDEPIKSCDTESTEIESEFTKGDIEYIPEEKHLLGKIAYTPPVEDPVIPDSLFTDEMVDGEIAIDHEYQQFIDDTVTTIQTNDTRPVINVSPSFHGKISPNPTSEQTTLELDVLHEGNFEIYLYAVEGKKIKSIYSGFMPHGQKIFNINISNYKSGSYLIVVNSEKQKETFKLEKVD